MGSRKGFSVPQKQPQNKNRNSPPLGTYLYKTNTLIRLRQRKDVNIHARYHFAFRDEGKARGSPLTLRRASEKDMATRPEYLP